MALALASATQARSSAAEEKTITWEKSFPQMKLYQWSNPGPDRLDPKDLAVRTQSPQGHRHCLLLPFSFSWGFWNHSIHFWSPFQTPMHIYQIKSEIIPQGNVLKLAVLLRFGTNVRKCIRKWNIFAQTLLFVTIANNLQLNPSDLTYVICCCLHKKINTLWVSNVFQVSKTTNTHITKINQSISCGKLRKAPSSVGSPASKPLTRRRGLQNTWPKKII